MADSPSPQRLCPKCEAQIRPGIAFCVSCGEPLSKPQESADHSAESSSSPNNQWAAFGAIAVLLTGLSKLISKKVVVVMIGAAGVSASAIGAVSDISSLGVNPMNSGGNDVEIVDLGFTEDGALDLKVENAGEDPVFFKRTDLQVENVWTLVPPYYYNPDPDVCPQSSDAYAASSHDYEISLPTQGAPYTATTSLSQSIKPNENDRFTISPNPDSTGDSMGGDYVYLMTLSLIYGSDDSVLSSQDLLFVAYSPGASRSYQPKDCFLAKNNVAQLKAENKQAISEIEGIQAQKHPDLGLLSQQIQ